MLKPVLGGVCLTREIYLFCFFLFLNDAWGVLISVDIAEENILDLSYPFNEQTVYDPIMEQLEYTFKLGSVYRGVGKQGQYYAAYHFSAAEHGGTHVDAPSHTSPNGSSVDKVPLSQLIGAAVVVDVSAKSRRNRDYQITIEDLQSWEAAHGRIPKRSILFLLTGWGQKWPHKNQIFGTKNFPTDPDYHYPGLHLNAARWLLKHRPLKALAIDTPSIDSGANHRTLPIHHLFSEANIPLAAFIANLEKMPPVGAVVVGLPMKIQGGTGGPLRLIAFNWNSSAKTDRVSEENEEEEESGPKNLRKIQKDSIFGINSSRASPSSSAAIIRPTAAPSVLPRKPKDPSKPASLKINRAAMVSLHPLLDLLGLILCWRSFL